MDKNKEIEIKIPYDLACKLTERMDEAGFEKLTPYICYILEQAIFETDSDDNDEKEEEEEVKEKLKRLGYL
jgi:hypothetical protein